MRDFDKLRIRDAEGGALLSIKAVPGASRDRIVGALGDCLKVSVAAPAEQGKANAAIERLLAKALDVPTNCVCVAAGESCPRKEMYIEGLSAVIVRDRLSRLA